MHRRVFVLSSAAAVAACASTNPSVDLRAVSAEAVGSAHTPREKVEAIVGWTHRRLDWTYTDYIRRTPEEVLARGGGNCAEQADVVRALLAPAGVRTRRMHEVNIQPESHRRQDDATQLVQQLGLRASVFGLRHNDHVWIEFEDADANEWRPAGPTINLIDFEQWTTARLGFGARPRHEVIPFADMKFPITVTIEENGTNTSRTQRYLIDAFGQYVPGAATSPHWRRWVELVAVADAYVVAAFSGAHNLHGDNDLMLEMIATYEAMRADA